MSAVRIAGGGLLVTGSSWESASQTRIGMWLAHYGRDGGRRFVLFAGRGVWVDEALGERAFVHVGDSARVQVVDLGSGRVVGQRRQPPPRLLLGRAAEPRG